MPKILKRREAVLIITEISHTMNARQIPNKILAYNPKIKKNAIFHQLIWRDQHMLQEAGTDLVWPHTRR
jgi:hypothetical protein